jgi:hypothetical protein
MDEDDDEYLHHVEYYLLLREKKRFWKHCPNYKFIEIINKTLYKPYKNPSLIKDHIEKIITKELENISDKEYEFTCIKNRQKSRQNDIGLFHQLILGACDGWVSSDRGIDLYNEQRFIYLELKTNITL